MYVLRPRDPECQMRRELIHTYNETVRLDGVFAVVHDECARTYLIQQRAFVDITDQMLDRFAAADELGAMVLNVDMWVRKGQLKGYGEGTEMLFMAADVQAFKAKRGENA